MAIPQEILSFIEAGVHFGHQVKRWNPKMEKFVFSKKSGLLIIDLEKTLKCLTEAQNFISSTVSRGGKILFVGTKKQVQNLIKDTAESFNMPYVNERWVGGTLTNFDIIREQARKFISMTEQAANNDFDNFTKKEVVLFNKDLEKMRKKFEGIKTLTDLPAAIIVVDPKKETLAVEEAVKMGIPVISVIDTDGNPDIIDYPIPANDDALKSLKAIFAHLVKGFDTVNKVIADSKAN